MKTLTIDRLLTIPALALIAALLTGCGAISADGAREFTWQDEQTRLMNDPHAIAERKFRSMQNDDARRANRERQ